MKDGTPFVPEAVAQPESLDQAQAAQDEAVFTELRASLRLSAVTEQVLKQAEDLV